MLGRHSGQGTTPLSQFSTSFTKMIGVRVYAHTCTLVTTPGPLATANPPDTCAIFCACRIWVAGELNRLTAEPSSSAPPPFGFGSVLFFETGSHGAQAALKLLM